jgi:lysozyme
MPRTSAAGLAHLVAEEGEVLTAYRDIAGVWTIGVGLTAASGVIRPVQGMTISAAESRRLLQLALARNYEPAVSAAMPKARPHEFDGGVSFHFNTGAIGRASWVNAWKARDPTGVRAGLALWNKAGGRTVRGLSRRRDREADLILLGRYADAGSAAGFAVLKRGMRGEAVRALQGELALLGLDPGPGDGVFGLRTEAAVRRLQAAHPDLSVDGIAGPATRAQMRRMRDAAIGPVAALAGSAIVATGTSAPVGFDAPGWLMPVLLIALLAALLVVLWRARDDVRAWLRLLKEKL